MNITEEQKAEFLKYYPEHEDKLVEIIEYNCLSSAEDDRMFCFYNNRFDPDKPIQEKDAYLNPVGMYTNLACYIERGDIKRSDNSIISSIEELVKTIHEFPYVIFDANTAVIKLQGVIENSEDPDLSGIKVNIYKFNEKENKFINEQAGFHSYHHELNDFVEFIYQFVNDTMKEYVENEALFIRLRDKNGGTYFMLHPNVYKETPKKENPENNTQKSFESIIAEWKQKVDKDLVMIGNDPRLRDEIKNKVEEDKLYLERLIAEANQQAEAKDENDNEMAESLNLHPLSIYRDYYNSHPEYDIEEKIDQAIIKSHEGPPIDLPEEFQEELIKSMKGYNDYFHNPNNELRGEYMDDLIEQLNNRKKECCLMEIKKDIVTWFTATNFFEDQEDELLSKLLEFDPVIEKDNKNHTLIKFKREVFDQNKEKIEKIQHQFFAKANDFTNYDFELDFNIVELTKDEHDFIVSQLKKHAIISSTAEPEFKGFFKDIIQYAPELENEEVEYIFEVTDKCLPTSVKNRL